MRRMFIVALVALFVAAALSPAYVEAPYSLGQVIKESTTIALVEVAKINKEKNLIIFKKLEDVKGKHPTSEIKHNIGRGGFHPREWQNIMNWAQEGKKAVFFHNGGASETCIGTYWYQAYAQGEWWGMSHAEPFMLRTYCGDPEKLVTACKAILAGQEVVVPCMQDGNKELLHQRKAKMQLMKASLKLGNYNAKRDFVAFGTDDANIDIPEFKTTVILKESSPGWRFAPLAPAVAKGDSWIAPNYDDTSWRTGQAPIGYGEEEIGKRQGTTIALKGVPVLFRRFVEVPQEVLDQKGVQLRLNVASDDCADVWINGAPVDKDADDHEFAYWNREIEVPLKLLKPGRNLIAALVKNKPMSSDLYLDMELVAQVPIPKPARKPDTAAVTKEAPKPAVDPGARADDKPPRGLTVDKLRKTVTIDCAIAPRKLPNLDRIYPIEVIATFPAPRGQKAHETIVTFQDLKPSHVHQALAECGLKAGKPAKQEGQRAEGPELTLSIEFPAADGNAKRVPIEELLVNSKTGKPIPAMKWHFTGSAMKQPDPEKDDKVYGADLTGTLITVFPVTDDTVMQGGLTLKDEAETKLEIARGVLPREGTPVKLIIQVK